MSFVQDGSNSAAVANATTITATLTGTTAGNLLRVVTAYANAGLTNFNVTVADGTNTWTQALHFYDSGNSGFNIAEWYAPNIAGGSVTVTATFASATAFQFIYVQERSGIAIVSPLNVAGTGKSVVPGTSSANALVGNSITTTGSGTTDVCAFAMDVNGTAAINAGTTLTWVGRTAHKWAAQGGSGTMGSEDLSSRVAGAYIATFGQGGNDRYVTFTTAYNNAGLVQKVTGGGTTNTTSFNLGITGVTAGNLLTVQMAASIFGAGGSNQSFKVPTDSSLGVWAAGEIPSTALAAGIAYLNNAAAGAHTLTFSLVSGLNMASYHFTICEWTGFPAVTVLDVASAASAVTSQSLSAGTISPAAAGELVLAAVVVGGDPGVTSLGITDPPSGFNSLQVGNNDQTDIGFEHCYKLASGTSSLSPTWNWTDATTTGSTAVIAAFGAPTLGSQTVGVQTGGLSTAALNYGLTNQSSTSSVGTITSEVDITLGSLTATFVEGSLLNQINLTGQTASFSEGTITTTVSGNVILALSGQSMGFSQGQLSLVISYLLDQDTITLVGQTATFALGVLQANLIVPLTPPALTFTEGTITTAPAYTLGSLTVTSLEGSITSSLGNNTNQSLIGQNITSSQGVMQFLPGATFPSNTLTFTEGTITFSATGDFTVSLTGLVINSSEGTITFTGTAPGFLTMPNVVGIGWLHASHILEKAGLFQTQPPLRVLSKVYPTYTVLGQEPPAGSLIPVNSAVQLTVSIDAPLLGASFDVIPLF